MTETLTLRRFFHDLATPLSGLSLHLERAHRLAQKGEDASEALDVGPARAGEGVRPLRAGTRFAPRRARPGVDLKVLIVEDDVATRKGLDLAIRDLGGQTRAVGTAGEAGRAIEEFKPEVLIVDLNLPDGDGIEVFRSRANPIPSATAS